MKTLKGLKCLIFWMSEQLEQFINQQQVAKKWQTFEIYFLYKTIRDNL